MYAGKIILTGVEETVVDTAALEAMQSKLLAQKKKKTPTRRNFTLDLHLQVRNTLHVIKFFSRKTCALILRHWKNRYPLLKEADEKYEENQKTL